MQAISGANANIQPFYGLKIKLVNIFWQGLTVFRVELYGCADSFVPLAVMGVAVRVIFLSWASPPLLTLAASLLISRVLLNLGKNLTGNPVEIIRTEIDKWNEAHPHLKVIASIFSVAIGILLPWLSFVSCIAAGCYLGVSSTIYRSSKNATQPKIQVATS